MSYYLAFFRFFNLFNVPNTYRLVRSLPKPFDLASAFSLRSSFFGMAYTGFRYTTALVVAISMPYFLRIA